MVMKLHNYRLSDVTTYETLTADRAYGKAIDIPLRMTNVTTLDEKAVFVAYKNSKNQHEFHTRSESIRYLARNFYHHPKVGIILK